MNCKRQPPSPIIFARLLVYNDFARMKKLFWLSSILLLVVLSLENCHPEPTGKPKTTNADPDSLYQGTKIRFDIISPNAALLLGPTQTPYADSLTVEGIQLGRRLFYDKHLSLDGHKACASCHQLQYALADSGYALSVNEFGHTKRNAMPLQNLAYAPMFFWDGRQPSIAAAAQDASQHEMGLPVTNALSYLEKDTTYVKLFKKAFGRPGNVSEGRIYLAIQEFLITAVTCNSHFDSVSLGITQFTTAEFDVFNNMFNTEVGDCFHCHGNGATQLMTTFAFQNNCLDSAATIYDFKDPGRGGITGSSDDYGTFKTPTLRNVAVSGPYMHDGRFTTLQQVMNHYSDSLQFSPTINSFLKNHFHKDSLGLVDEQVGGLHLTAQQKQEFIEFLNGFTDTSFMNNPNLKNPFQ